MPQPKIIFGCGGFKKFHSRKKFWLWPFSEHQKNGCGKIEISFWLWNLYGPIIIDNELVIPRLSFIKRKIKEP